MTRTRFEGRPRDMLRDATTNRSTEVEMIFLRRAGQAVVLGDGEGAEVVLPASQLEFDLNATEGDAIVVTMPEWLAVQEGLV
ncbi:MAG: hypothetical protein AAF416_15570 [Pseudomonadota bacterium]